MFDPGGGLSPPGAVPYRADVWVGVGQIIQLTTSSRRVYTVSGGETERTTENATMVG